MYRPFPPSRLFMFACFASRIISLPAVLWLSSPRSTRKYVCPLLPCGRIARVKRLLTATGGAYDLFNFQMQLLEIAAGLGLILSTLLVGCSEVANNTHGPSTSPTQANISCTQPASNKFSLVGLAYGAAHTGQNPLNGIFPSNEEVTADMSTLASLTHYIRTYSSTGNAS